MNGAEKAPTTQRVIGAARGLFYSQGYEVTIDTIAQRASVAKPTVYVHFGSKDALIQAVLEAGSAEFFSQLELEVARYPDDPVAQLLAPIDLLTAGLPDPGYRGCLCINAAATFPDPAHPAHRVLRDLDQRLLDLWAGLAAQAGASQPGALARQLLLLFDGVKARGLTDSSGACASDARAAARALLDHNRRTVPLPVVLANQAAGSAASAMASVRHAGGSQAAVTVTDADQARLLHGLCERPLIAARQSLVSLA